MSVAYLIGQSPMTVIYHNHNGGLDTQRVNMTRWLSVVLLYGMRIYGCCRCMDYGKKGIVHLPNYTLFNGPYKKETSTSEWEGLKMLRSNLECFHVKWINQELSYNLLHWRLVGNRDLYLWNAWWLKMSESNFPLQFNVKPESRPRKQKTYIV